MGLDDDYNGAQPATCLLRYIRDEPDQAAED